LPLDGRTQRRELALEARTALGLLGRDRAVDTSGLALGRAYELLGATLRRGQGGLGLRGGGCPDLVRLAACGRKHLGDLVLGPGPELARGELRACESVGGLGVRLGDDVARLFLGAAQELLDARAEPRVRRPLGLPQLAVRLGELARDLHGLLVELLDLGAGLGERLLERGDARVYVGLVVPAHDGRELHALV